MLFSKSKIFICLLIWGLIFPAALYSSTLKEKQSEGKESKSDSISLQIKTYENLVEEMQRQPSSYSSLVNIMSQLGDLYSANEDYPKAIYLYMRSIIIRQLGHTSINQDKSFIAWQLIEVGNSFYRLNDYQLAEKAYTVASHYFRRINDKQGQITAINNIGLCKLNQHKPDLALPLFKKTLAYSQEINDIPRIYSSNVYIGISLKELKRYKEAITVLKEAAKYEMEDKNLDLAAFRKLQLGDTYILFGDTAKGLQTYFQLTNNVKSTSDSYYKSVALSRLGHFYFDNGNNQLAQKYAGEGYEFLKNKHHLNLLTDLNELLYKIYKKSGNSTKALFHFEAFYEGTMQLNNKEIEKFVSDYNQKMERIAISQEIKDVREKSERIQIEKSNQQKLSIFLIIIAFLLLIILFTSKGFDSRIKLLIDHVKSFSINQKILLTILIGVYFIVFFYFFVPVESTMGLRKLGFIEKVFPGLIAYSITLIITFALYFTNSLNKIRVAFSLNAFVIVFISVLFGEFIHFYFCGFGGFNFLLSLALIVLASFILPLYLFILIMEKLIMKHVEAISQSLNQYLGEIKQQPGPKKKLITIQSEKTTSNLTFDISELLAVEAQGNYSMFILYQNNTVNRKILHITMKAIEDNLAEYKFIIRCHKSYMVNIHYIEKVTGNSRGYLLHFDNGADAVPVSRNFQKNVMDVIRQFKDGF